MAITKEEVLKMDLKSIFAAIKHPDTAADMQNLLGARGSGVATYVSKLMQDAQTEAAERESQVDAQIARTIPPSTEALAAEASAMAAEPVTVVEPAAEVVVTPVVPVVKPHEAEDAELKKIGITVLRDADGKPTRYIEEYQVTGEDGTPIGRPTHLESRTLVEHFSKQREVHVQATRAFHRLKKQKLTFKNDESKLLLTPEQISAAAEVALQEKDVTKAQDVVREIIKTEFGKQNLTLQEQKDFVIGQSIGNQFKANHLYDYYPCEANQKAMSDYLTEHQLDFTLDTLEAAFTVLAEENKLVPVPKQHRAETKVAEVVNPTAAATTAAPAAPAIPVAETPAVVVPSVVPQPTAPSQPVAETTVSTPAAAPNVQPAARRPGVNGSLPPGTLSAQRPGAPEPALARKEFLKMVHDMDSKVMKAKLKNDPQFVKQLESYGIKVR
jgi:hypothetical protein